MGMKLIGYLLGIARIDGTMWKTPGTYSNLLKAVVMFPGASLIHYVTRWLVFIDS